MTIVYAGPLDPAGSCLSRLRALQQLEKNIVPFDTQPYFKSKSLLARVGSVLDFSGREFQRINADLLSLCRQHSPEIIWFDKATWLTEPTVKTLRETGAFLVHHITDALYPHSMGLQRSMRLIRKTLRYFNLFLTTNLDDYELLQKRGMKSARLTCLGYDHDVFNDSPISDELAEKWASDLVFVGHHEPRTERGMAALVEAGLNVAVYGPGWERARSRRKLDAALKYKPLYLSDYANALKGAKIGLSFFSELNYCHTAMRSFETTACGTFLLAMRSAQHLEFFKEGEEAEFFGDEKELVEKARHFLSHETAREEIARAGHERCVNSDYSWARFMRDDWKRTLEEFRRREMSAVQPTRFAESLQP